MIMCKKDSDKIVKALEREELIALQRVQAVKRMRKLDLRPEIIENFEDDKKLYRSENFRIGANDGKRYAVVYSLRADETEMVRKWEKRTGNLVYHVILNKMEFGTCYSFLYVSSNPEDWKDDMRDLETWEDDSLYPLVYVMNIDDEHCSEYGTIGIRPDRGGLLRTA